MSTKENILNIIPKNNYFNNSVKPKCLKKCNGCGTKQFNKCNFKNIQSLISVNKSIQNTNKVSESLYLSNKSSLAITKNPCPPNRWNQSSDKQYPSHPSAIIPTKANTLKTTTANLRPGALAPGGFGVDIKHNSYNRYYGRIKGKAITPKLITKNQLINSINFININQSIQNNKPFPLMIGRGYYGIPPVLKSQN